MSNSWKNKVNVTYRISDRRIVGERDWKSESDGEVCTGLTRLFTADFILRVTETTKNLYNDLDGFLFMILAQIE